MKKEAIFEISNDHAFKVTLFFINSDINNNNNNFNKIAISICVVGFSFQSIVSNLFQYQQQPCEVERVDIS